MTTEQNKTLEVLQIAIQMEIDGKAYYLKASQQSSNDLGKKLLLSLANEENIHQQNFEKIYNSIKQKNSWPQTTFQPDGGKKLRTIFAHALDQMSTDKKATTTEQDSVKIAMGMENKTLDFYNQQYKTAIYPAEKDFYQILAAEEREHYLILLDYFEYLKDPASWFVNKEHPSMDAG
ncbi:MAG: ferritin family protein [Dehalococcoidales bacterium]|nr:ferritin family protein [Dehalococcoidales bacterium]